MFIHYAFKFFWFNYNIEDNSVYLRLRLCYAVLNIFSITISINWKGAWIDGT